MPWVHGDDYSKSKKAELKHLLLLRRLPYSGNKEKMVSRLIVHDVHLSVYRSVDFVGNLEYLLISQTAPFHFANSQLNFATRSTS